MNIKEKTLDEVAVVVEKLIEKIHPDQPYPETAIKEMVDDETGKALMELLSIRGQLVERFKGVFNVIDSIETNVKAKKFPVGTYGISYPLKITMVQKTEVYTDKVMQAIKDAKLNPIDYMVLDLKNTTIAEMISKNKNFTVKVPNYNKHNFG